ncbi:hypothetical protein [Paenibacillus wulumuqiensis]|uniref:hypothetical protein n=1 Tax=Paenibacillus wulumuqiensis TaxID=1567107 RepID=UPI000619633D|nr:hypothetical protein [Paenibacillus wulumuqiensis]
MKLFYKQWPLTLNGDHSQPQIETPLGTIHLSLVISGRCYLSNYSSKLPKGGSLYTYYYDSFDCELIICRPKLNMNSHLIVEECWGAVFRIKPHSGSQIDTCSFSAYWEANYNWTHYGSNTGENLDAAAYENQIYQLHLGTQDMNTLITRKNRNDMIPKSLGSNPDIEHDHSIQLSDRGISVAMTPIDSGEICQIHFLTAWNKNVKDEIASWYAVDQNAEDILKGEEIW